MRTITLSTWWQTLAVFALMLAYPGKDVNATCYVWMPNLNTSGNCVQASYYPSSYGTVLTMWAKNVNGTITPVTNWSSNTSMSYCPTQPGWYRLCAKRWGCSKVYETQDVYISSCTPITNAGSISGAGGTYCGSFNPPPFSGTIANGGSGGTVKYKWQYRTPGGNWKNAQSSGCNNKSGYNPPTLHQSYEFRRLAKRYGCGNWIASNVISITITNSLSNGGHITGASGVQCEGFNPGSYTGNMPSGSNGGAIVYKWQTRTSNGQWTDSNASGSTSKSGFAPGVLTETTKIRRLAKLSGCGVWRCSNTITVYIKAAPVVNAGVNQTICEGESATLTATATGCGPFSYSWDNSLGNGAVKTVTPTLTTYKNKGFWYNVTVSDGNGCTDTDKVKVIVESTPQVTVANTNPACGGATGSITFSFPDHPNRTGIEFSIDGGTTWPSAYRTNDSNGTLTINGLAAGDYDLITRWGNDECPVDLGAANLSDVGGPTVNAGADVTICEGESATLGATASGNGPFSFEWNKGLGAGQSVTVSPTLPEFKNKNINYTVTVTDGNGCTGTDVVKVKVRSLPDVTVSTTEPSCLGNDASIIFSFPDHPNRTHIEFSQDGGATWPSSLRSADDAGSLTVSNLASGTYQLAVRWGNNECPVDLPDAILNPGNGGCASLGDYVWYDDNRDGIFDNNEGGVSGVTVNLYKCGETDIQESQDTDLNGFYKFENLLPGMSYYVEFAPATLPGDYVFTTADQGGNDALDSDADANGVTACVTLSAGEYYVDLDAGIFQPVASLGDFVWDDTNKDGIRDAGETGIAGVEVTLTDCNDNFVASTNTLGDGSYGFSGLNPGTYKVSFNMTTLPSGYVFTQQYQGGDDTQDSDVNPTSGMTDCITLVAGENNPDIDAGAYQSSDCTVDAGTVRMACVSGIFCRQFGRANVYGWRNGDQVIPNGYSVAYVLTAANTNIIEQISPILDFEITSNGDYAVHPMVYNSTMGDSEYFDPATVVLGTTTITDLAANFPVGGGGKCGDLDVAGTAVLVMTCVDPPSQDDYAYTAPETPVSGNLRANDGNPYGHPLWIKFIVGVENGTMTLAPDGQFTYTPNPGFEGIDSARYRLSDTTICNHRNSYSWVYISVSSNENTVPGEPNISDGPVVFLEVTVEKAGMANELTWVTLEDTVQVEYQVERSFDNVLFERIHETEAVGEPGMPETYEMTEDGTLYEDYPQLYYRIRTVDPQGYFTFSETVVLNQDLAEPLLMEVYPVPAISSVSATWSLRDEPAKVIMMNGLGQTIEMKSLETGEYETSFDVTRLTPGVYYLQVQAGGYINTKSFIVER